MNSKGRLLSVAFLLILVTTTIESRYTRPHGHRHKRQHGAHLYLPESYIIPQGEGDPSEWGQWGSPSECSRTCGGGVAYQTRECLNIGPDDRPRCTGGNKKYFSCNSQDCPDDELDFRSQQCANFNSLQIEGVRYDWVPYTKAPNPCELNCMPRGQRFYYRHKAKVIDGTRCNDESPNVCIDGQCQPVGCDMMLGSSAREDKCRKCSGDGSSCKTVSGLLDMNNMQVGYNDILLIPSGATNIEIKEISPSNNYLAIRNLTAHYYLNGNWRIDFPRKLNFAGSIWHYDRRPQGFAAPDHITCVGPTTEPVYLVILYQDRNVGIQYEYSVPEASAHLAESDSYSWTFNSYEPCSVSCGGGFQSRKVTCNSRMTLEEVDGELCGIATKPADTQKCGQESCPPRWTDKPFGNCSTVCGTNGTQTRQVECETVSLNGVSTIIDDSVCLDQVGNKPVTVNPCNVGIVCPVWHIGPWQPCDKLCGNGVQKRQLKCYRKIDGKIEVLNDGDCPEAKPDETKECILRPCEGVDWITSSWSGCKTCGLTQETRTAFCASKTGTIYNETFCANHMKPELIRPCDAPACEYQWFKSQWSKCSSECGKGVQTRRVLCAQFDGDVVRPADDDSKCSADEKPSDSKECEGEKECPGQWFSGPWSSCDKDCGGGKRTRKVMCLDNGKAVPETKCSKDTIEFSTDECNLIPCIEDETIPVDVTAKPIEEDDESDDYCDEDEDEEGEAFETESGVLMVKSTPFKELVSEGIEMDGSDRTESTLFTEELMLSDATGFETELTESATDIITGSTYDGSGDVSIDARIGEDEGSGDMDSKTDESITQTSVSGEASSASISAESSATSSSSESASESDSSKSEDITTESSASSIDSKDITTDSASSQQTEAETSAETLSASVSETAASVSASESSPSATTTKVSESAATSPSDASPSTTESTASSTESETSSSDIPSTTESSSSSSDASTSSSDIPSTTDESLESTTTSKSVSSTDEATTTDSQTVTSSADTSTDKVDATESTEKSGSTESSVASASTDVDISVTTDDVKSGSTDQSSTDAADSSTLATELDSATTDSSATGGSTDMTESADITTTSDSSSDKTTDGVEIDARIGEDVSEGTTESGSETGATESADVSTIAETKDFDIWSTTIASDVTSTGSVDDEELGTTSDTSPNTLEAIIKKEQTPKKCKLRPKIPACLKAEFGCCADNKTTALGPFDQGCPVPETCKDTPHGCCPDGLSPAQDKKNKGCPKALCTGSLFGCCSDGRTEAQGQDMEGCPIITTTTEAPTTKPAATTTAPSEDEQTKAGATEDGVTDESVTDEGVTEKDCKASTYGCCPDGLSEATGENFHGCANIDETDCTKSFFGCCSDNTTTAKGPNGEGCAMCVHEPFGCCLDNVTPAHGPNKEGCCLESRFGCCPDNIVPARGPQLEGCSCEYSAYGCCPNNKTSARGHYNEGCGCEYSEFGCCPDKLTAAGGAKYEGCPCHTFQFGCCPDGITVPLGPHGYGCHCSHTEFKCCSDGVTPAKGPNFEGCTCETSKHGCCPDGIASAEGKNFEGCENVSVSPQSACTLGKETGSCSNFTIKHYFDYEYGACTRFWYGGCGGNGNRFDTKEDCTATCEQPQGKASCLLPKIHGPCTGYYTSYYYDADRNVCSQFVYGGCLGNTNRFETIESCEKQCVVDSSASPCEQPVEAGPCNGTFENWYYDQESDTCQRFNYGGCKGNKNRYPTEHSCTYHCKTPGAHKASCALPKDQGSCTSRHARWHYSQTDQKCMPFYFTGCGGNKNSYISLEQCEEQCPQQISKDLCFKPAEAGECQNYTVRWYYDTKEERCRQYYYGGCGGNENNFIDEVTCMSRCEQKSTTTTTTVAPRVRQPEPDAEQPTDANQCYLEYDSGPCRVTEARWYYNRQEGLCDMFAYGGCGGNGNNFQSVEQCETACGHLQSACSLPPVYGRCQENTTRWHYDSRTDECYEFQYSGCRGNKNNFYTNSECRNHCQVRQPPATDDRQSEPDLRPRFDDEEQQPEPDCGAPMAEGDCDRSILSYFYNRETGICEQFHYTGCGGNGNRFNSQNECESQCASGRAVCLLPVRTGECDSYGRRWAYDDSRGTCIQFIYSGCDGNGNNFESLESCISLCRPDDRDNVIDHDQLRTSRPDECDQYQSECESLHCPYGISRSYDDRGCTRCECENPCRGFLCPDDSKCAVDIQQDADLGTAFTAVCRKINKPGECPSIENSTRCDQECYSDADCRSNTKCCYSGCGYVCIHPAESHVTYAPPAVDHQRPAVIYPGAVQLEPKPQKEIDVVQPEGDVATLRCFATGYPAPTVTWKRGTIIINTNQGRYVITSTGDLQIVQVHRSDSGTYVCIADNGIGVPVQREVNLTVADPVQGKAYIVGDTNSTKIVRINQPATIRCLAGGYPKPYVTWWKGSELLSLKSNRHEVNRDFSLIFNKVELTDLGPYICYAYSGKGKPVSIYVTLKAYGPANAVNPDEEPYLKYIVMPDELPVMPTTRYPYHPPVVRPVIVVPVIHVPVIVEQNITTQAIVPVTTRIILPNGNQFGVGSDITIQCEVGGYPPPKVIWYKNDQELYDSQRIQISESHRLLILSATSDDTGYYKCAARNDISQSYHAEQINVDGVYVPEHCTDNPGLANCNLIVKAKYCTHKYYARFCCRSCTLSGQLFFTSNLLH